MRALRLFAFGAVLCVGLGCGDRTGLLVPGPEPAQREEAGIDAAEDRTVPEVQGPNADAGQDLAVDASLDAPADVTVDASVDAPIDVLSPVDLTHPRPVACQEAGAAAALIYLITEQSDLWSFYPPSLAFRKIGAIHCPAPPGNIPFSMAVDHTGIAYVAYVAPGGTGPGNGALFRVSTATGLCEATPYVPGQHGFQTFGMGYSQNPSGVGETLFVASSDLVDSGVGSQLGFIDTTRFTLQPVGRLPSRVLSAELTGTGAGDLFAFYSLIPGVNGVPSPPPSAIGRINKADGALLSETILPNVGQGCGWAFAFWGGDFYTFTAPSTTGSCNAPPSSVVTRLRPSDGSITEIARLGEVIVGAGVSTCAPQQ